jgi:TolA-binding protein
MRVIDLHPEDLLDRHAEGTLTDADRVRLETHVQSCTACRFELAARRDFSDLAALAPRSTLITEPGVESPHDTARIAVFGSASSGGRTKAKRRVALIALAAALAAGVSLAAAAVRIIARDQSESRARTNSELLDTKRANQARTLAPVASVQANHTIVGETSASGSAPVKLDDLPVAGPKAGGAELGQVKAAEQHSAPGAAAALFRAANEARRDRDGARAIALYRRLEAQHPSSEEARLSYATLGRLLLDRGDARSALDEFDEYLSHGGGPLGEEALVGRALSLQKLGSVREEITAWNEILRRFPRSVHARLARARLSALGER